MFAILLEMDTHIHYWAKPRTCETRSGRDCKGLGIARDERFPEITSPSGVHKETEAQHWWSHLPTDTWPISENLGLELKTWTHFSHHITGLIIWGLWSRGSISPGSWHLTGCKHLNLVTVVPSGPVRFGEIHTDHLCLFCLVFIFWNIKQ